MTTAGEGPRLVHVAIEVEGIIDPRWSEWFNGQEVRLTPSTADASRTTLTADLPDQSALPALLASVTGLNLRVISVTPKSDWKGEDEEPRAPR
jgi:hypothetical protein